MIVFRPDIRVRPAGNHDHVRRAGVAAIANVQPVRPTDAGRPRLITVWTMGSGGRFECHWDIELPPLPPI